MADWLSWFGGQRQRAESASTALSSNSPRTPRALSSAPVTPFDDLKLDRTKRMIRLWKFVQIHDARLVHIEMRVFADDVVPEYIALSYVWGSPVNKHTIYVNGFAHHVTQNLFDFLKVLRTSSEGGCYEAWYWADQISMNQADDSERDHQVAMMGDIYRGSSCVFAYLGDEPKPPRDAKLFDRVIQALFRPPLYDTLAYLDVLTRPYWSRLWVVQELHLAQTAFFWIGHQCVHRDVLEALAVHFESNPDFSKILVGHPSDQLGRQYQERILMASFKAFKDNNVKPLSQLLADGNSHEGDCLHYVLGKFSHKLCSDPRDKVFGLQALVAKEERTPVDYSMSMDQLICTVIRVLIVHDWIAPYRAWSWLTEFNNNLALRSNCLSDFAEQLPASVQTPRRTALAMCWAYMLPRIPEDILWPEEPYDILQGEWRTLWGNVLESAITPKQMAMAHELDRLSREYTVFDGLHLLGYSYAWEDEENSNVSRDVMCRHCGRDLGKERIYDPHGESSYLGIPRRLAACVYCERYCKETQRIIETAAERHGFTTFGEFLYHPDEWPFDSNSSNSHTTWNTLEGHCDRSG